MGLTVSFCCIVAGVYALLMSLSVSLDLREEMAALCLSVLISEFLTSLCAVRAALPALMWLSASGCSCCQERRDSSARWPERCSTVPVVLCVSTSQVKSAPATRRSGERSSTTS